MKKLAIAFAAIAAFSAPALAADMPVRAPVYQPPPPVYNWTGFSIWGGGGGGLWNAESNVVASPSGFGRTRDQRLGRSRGFGTARAAGRRRISPPCAWDGFVNEPLRDTSGAMRDPLKAIQRT